MNPIEGAKRATVIEVADPLAAGRVLVRFSDAVSDSPVWARIDNPGSTAQLEIGDEVLVAFAGGDPRNPVVLGNLWHDDAPPPAQADTNSKLRSVKSIVRPRAGK